jgi:hypothetical protein
MSDAPWVLVTTSPFGIRCQRCGNAWLIGLPGSVEAVLASVAAFADRHRACPEGDETPSRCAAPAGSSCRDWRSCERASTDLRQSYLAGHGSYS